MRLRSWSGDARYTLARASRPTASDSDRRRTLPGRAQSPVGRRALLEPQPRLSARSRARRFATPLPRCPDYERACGVGKNRRRTRPHLNQEDRRTTQSITEPNTVYRIGVTPSSTRFIPPPTSAASGEWAYCCRIFYSGATGLSGCFTRDFFSLAL